MQVPKHNKQVYKCKPKNLNTTLLPYYNVHIEKQNDLFTNLPNAANCLNSINSLILQILLQLPAKLHLIKT